ncbi:MAG: hypothetical protein Rhirs2KO_26610 [Rhizobiaceae bacterium]
MWLENGRLAATSRDRNIRDALQWGALDKKVIVCAEDRDISKLHGILSQDHDLERDVAIIPFSGVSKMGSGHALAAFRQSLGNKHKFIVYRDRDCQTNEELERWFKEYSDLGYGSLISSGVEIENEYIDPANISYVIDVDYDTASEIVSDAIKHNEDELRAKFRSKRQSINITLHKDGGSPSTDDLWENLPEYRKFGGKMLLSKIYQEIERRRLSRFDLLQTVEEVTIGAPLISAVRNQVYT